MYIVNMFVAIIIPESFAAGISSLSIGSTRKRGWYQKISIWLASVKEKILSIRKIRWRSISLWNLHQLKFGSGGIRTHDIEMTGA
jgi:hypothetical protein